MSPEKKGIIHLTDRPTTPEIAVEPDDAMISAGADALDDLLVPGGDLTCSPTHAAEKVYRAMERVRVAALSHRRNRLA